MSRTSDPLPKEELTGDEFLALCERSKRGEIHMSMWGTGSRPGYWRVRYTEGGTVVQHSAERELDLLRVPKDMPEMPEPAPRPYGQWFPKVRAVRSHFKAIAALALCTWSATAGPRIVTTRVMPVVIESQVAHDAPGLPAWRTDGQWRACRTQIGVLRELLAREDREAALLRHRLDAIEKRRLAQVDRLMSRQVNRIIELTAIQNDIEARYRLLELRQKPLPTPVYE